MQCRDTAFVDHAGNAQRFGDRRYIADDCRKRGFIGRTVVILDLDENTECIRDTSHRTDRIVDIPVCRLKSACQGIDRSVGERLITPVDQDTMGIACSEIGETTHDRNLTVFPDVRIYRDADECRRHVVHDHFGVIITETTVLIDDSSTHIEDPAAAKHPGWHKHLRRVGIGRVRWNTDHKSIAITEVILVSESGIRIDK